MALDGTYTGLVASIADWLNRSDLTAQIPDFITLLEAQLKRDLHRYSKRAAITISARNTAAPADVQLIKSLYLQTGQPTLDNPLRLCTPEMLAERQARSANVAARPDSYAFMNGEILVSPTPDQSYTGEIFYRIKVVPLTVGNPTTTLFTDAPDLYLYGALMQAAPFLENDERLAVWKPLFEAAIAGLNLQTEQEEYDGSTRDVRLPIVFG